ncbi:transporter [Sulfolobus acidocaldarius SUSAZ]|nr:transporter [Sulfolobus acidocaldarius SUSAZ]
MQRDTITFFKWIIPLSLAWGIAYPLTKLVTFSVSPILVSVARVIIGTIFFYFLGRGFSIGIKQFVNALFNVIILLASVNVGIYLSPSPGLVATMIYTQPIFVLVIELILGSKISLRGMSGVIIGVLGVLISATLSFNIGLLSGIMGSLSWAIGTVYYYRNLSKDNVIKLNAFMSLISIPFLSSLTPLDYYFNFSVTSVVLLLILALIAQVAGFYFWFNAVRDLGSVSASTGSLLVPVIAYLTSILILKVIPNVPEIIGLILILIGVYLSLNSRNGK